MMEHLPRFRRKPKSPAVNTDAKLSPSALAPVHTDAVLPATAERDATPDKPPKPPRRSPFRALHLKKRARSPPPLELPAPPSPAIVTQDGVIEHAPPHGSRPGTRHDGDGRDAPAQDDAAPARTYRIPGFLNLSGPDLESKFHELVWAERGRIAQGMANENDDENKWSTFKLTDPKKFFMDRYSNIKPWNHNRIKLHVPAGQLDYVNASTILLTSPSSPATLPPLRYIAMQGPTEPSLDYVWRMVAEQLSSPVVIVQLTSMYENGMQKCFPYFPHEDATGTWQLNQSNTWGDSWRATLRFSEVQNLEEGTIELRKVLLRVGGESQDRVVWHFLYKRWPDFGVPAIEDIGSFLALMRLSREYNTADQPRIIHCSAGVGRTGTFITVEHLMRELDAGYLEDYDGAGEGDDLIFKTVDGLREQRRSMVQSEAQYMFLYQVLRRLWQEKYGVVSEADEEPAPKRLEVEEPFTDGETA